MGLKCLIQKQRSADRNITSWFSLAGIFCGIVVKSQNRKKTTNIRLKLRRAVPLLNPCKLKFHTIDLLPFSPSLAQFPPQISNARRVNHPTLCLEPPQNKTIINIQMALTSAVAYHLLELVSTCVCRG